MLAPGNLYMIKMSDMHEIPTNHTHIGRKIKPKKSNRNEKIERERAGQMKEERFGERNASRKAKNTL